MSNDKKEFVKKLLGTEVAQETLGPICIGCHNGFTNLKCPAHGGVEALAEWWKVIAWNQRRIAMEQPGDTERAKAQKIVMSEAAKIHQQCADDLIGLLHSTKEILGPGDLRPSEQGKTL